MEVKGIRTAFDICFCNMALNYLMKEKGESFDRDGRQASQGAVNQVLLKEIQQAYRGVRKKRASLGREFLRRR